MIEWRGVEWKRKGACVLTSLTQNGGAYICVGPWEKGAELGRAVKV